MAKNKDFDLVSKQVKRKEWGPCGWIETTDFYVPHKKPKKRFTFQWSFSRQSYVEGLMARITTEQQVSVEVKPVTPGGHPARIDGDVVFTSSDETVATVTSTGQRGALVKSVGPGVTQIVATFDADLSGDVREVVLSGALEVVEAEADTGVIEFGTPELIP